MSLPRVLWLGDDNTLRMAPADELAQLRHNPRKLGPLTVDGVLPLDDIAADRKLKIAARKASQVSFTPIRWLFLRKQKHILLPASDGRSHLARVGSPAAPTADRHAACSHGHYRGLRAQPPRESVLQSGLPVAAGAERGGGPRIRDRSGLAEPTLSR